MTPTTHRVAVLFISLLTGCKHAAEGVDLPGEIPSDASGREVAFKPYGHFSQKLEYTLDNQKVGERLYYDNRRLGSEQLFRDGELHGVCREFFESGARFSERPYRHGRLDGTCRFWDEDGQLLVESTLVNGNGVLHEYRLAVGGIASDAYIPYVNGVIEGTRRVHGRFGVSTDVEWATEFSEYHRGQEDGWSYVVSDAGKLIESAYFRRGRLHGVYRRFLSDGGPAEGYPKYFVDGREIPLADFTKAATSDPGLQITLQHDRPDKERPRR